MTTYALIGAAGFVAPRHMKAIHDTGGELIAVLDPHDSVGILDSYFPNAFYFKEFERFDRFCSKACPDYVVVCSPNYLHDSHCLFGLRIGAQVICEKPLALNERNLDALIDAEYEYGSRVWNILQLRLMECVPEMQRIVAHQGFRTATMTYHTPRGEWYDYSWKSDVSKSGGAATNIGIHLFDLILFLLGDRVGIAEWNAEHRRENGMIVVGDDNVSVFIDLRIDKKVTAKRTFNLGATSFDLSTNFGDLHTKSYEEILKGNGFGIEEVRPAIRLCEMLR